MIFFNFMTHSPHTRMKTNYRKSTIQNCVFVYMCGIQIRLYEGSFIFVFVYFLFASLLAQSRKDSRLREELKISDHMNIELFILVWFEKYQNVGWLHKHFFRNTKMLNT